MTQKESSEQLEGVIQRKIGDWLENRGIFFWRHNNIPVFDRFKHSYRQMPKFTRRGMPDFLCLYRGVLVGIEVKKTGGGLLSVHQKEICRLFNENGAKYFVADSLEVAIAKFSLYRDTIPVPVTDIREKFTNANLG